MKMKKILSVLLSAVLLVLAVGCDLSFIDPPTPDSDFVPPVYTEILAENFSDTYRDQLSPNEVHIYDEIVALSPGTLTVSLSLPEQPILCKGREPTKEETDAIGEKISYWTANALYAIWLDHPEIFWLSYSKYALSYEMKSDDEGLIKITSLTVTLEKAEGIDDISALREALENAVKDFHPTGETVAEKVAYIDRYLCQRITYELDAENRGNVIGALINGKCVCEGYAQAFLYLCGKADIPAVNIPGKGVANGESEGHMWNAVKIGDAYYGVDVTWNSTTNSTVYLLVGEDTVCHGSAFGETHLPDMLTKDGAQKPFALPKITKNAYQGTED